MELVYHYWTGKEHVSEGVSMAVFIYQVCFRHKSSLNIDLTDTSIKIALLEIIEGILQPCNIGVKSSP